MSKAELKGFDYWKAVVARWIVVNVAMRLSPLGVMSMCMEMANTYYESIQAAEEDGL